MPKLFAFLIATLFSIQLGIAQTGTWSAPSGLPVTSIHCVMLPTGKLMMWNRRGDTYLWDPATGASSKCAQPPFDTFCAGHVLLPDGTVFVAGGHVVDYVGLPNVATYNPYTDTWKSLPNMAYARWYPTLAVLPNGNDVFINSGEIDPTNGIVTTPEVWDSSLGQFRQLSGASNYPDLYPQLYLSPRGTVFSPGPQIRTSEFTTTGPGSMLSTTSNPLNLDLAYGSSAVYAPGRAIVAGGGTPVANSELVDFSTSNPVWTAGPTMSVARRQFDLTLLPTGDVLATGGSSGPGFTNPSYPVFATEVWTPGTSNWRQWAPSTLTSDMASYRGYHSNAVLLPDGRIYSSTGDDGRDPNKPNPSYQLFTPPYLLTGSRPVVSNCPTSALYGDQIQFSATSSVPITSASLVRLTSVTHCMNTGQIYCPLTLTPSSLGFAATLPTDNNYMPPGFYMLYVFDATGAHSLGQILRISSQLPRPRNISASIVAGKVVINWDPASTSGETVQALDSDDAEESEPTGISDNSGTLSLEPSDKNYVCLQTIRGDSTSAMSGPIRITPGTTSLNAQIVTGYNEYHTSAKAQLVDDKGIGVPYATVQLTIGGANVAQGVTDESGNVEIGFIESPTMLGQTAQFSFPGNGILSGCSTTSSTNFLPEPTQGLCDSVTAPVGTTVKLGAHMMAMHFYEHCPEANMNVTFSVDGNVVGSALTDATGNAYLDYQIPNDGNASHTVLMVCSGDAYFAGASAYGKVVVGAGPTQIWVGSKSLVVGQTWPVPITLSYAPGTTYIPGATLNVLANGVQIGSVTTDSTGWAHFSYTAPSTPGTVALTVTFPGNANALASTSSVTIPVGQDNSYTWVASSYKGYANRAYTITSTLQGRASKLPIGGATLTFAANGTPFGTGVTDSTGTATCSFTPTAGSPTIPITISFAGSSSYKASSASSTFTVMPDTGSVWTRSKTGFVNQPVTFAATVRDATTNTYLAGKTVTFTLNGTTVGSATTDSTGWCYLTITSPSTTGSYPITANFAGDATITGSSYSATLTVAQDTGYLWIGSKTATHGQLVTVPATAQDSVTHTYVPNQTITFTINGLVVGTAVTDSNGWCSVTFSAPATAGTYTILGSWSGTSTITAATNTAKLTVK